MEVIPTPPHLRRVDKLLNEKERRLAETEIAAEPEAWPVIAGTGGARKARVRRGSRGKSGGARIIYFFRAKSERVYLMAIYAKSEREDITDAEKHELRAAITALP